MPSPGPRRRPAAAVAGWRERRLGAVRSVSATARPGPGRTAGAASPAARPCRARRVARGQGHTPGTRAGLPVPRLTDGQSGRIAERDDTQIQNAKSAHPCQSFGCTKIRDISRRVQLPPNQPLRNRDQTVNGNENILQLNECHCRRGGLPAADGRSASPCRADSPLIASRMQPARRSGGTQSAD